MYPSISEIVVFRPEKYDWSPQLIFYQNFYNDIYCYQIRIVNDIYKIPDKAYIISSIETMEEVLRFTGQCYIFQTDKAYLAGM